MAWRDWARIGGVALIVGGGFGGCCVGNGAMRLVGGCAQAVHSTTVPYLNNYTVVPGEWVEEHAYVGSIAGAIAGGLVTYRLLRRR